MTEDVELPKKFTPDTSHSIAFVELLCTDCAATQSGKYPHSTSGRSRMWKTQDRAPFLSGGAKVNTFCKAARAERKGTQRTPTLSARSSFVRHNSESVRSCFDAHLLEASTYDLELKTALRAVAVVRSSGNTQPAEFVLVILSVQHVPFFAAF